MYFILVVTFSYENTLFNQTENFPQQFPPNFKIFEPPIFKNFNGDYQWRPRCSNYMYPAESTAAPLGRDVRSLWRSEIEDLDKLWDLRIIGFGNFKLLYVDSRS